MVRATSATQLLANPGLSPPAADAITVAVETECVAWFADVKRTAPGPSAAGAAPPYERRRTRFRSGVAGAASCSSIVAGPVAARRVAVPPPRQPLRSMSSLLARRAPRATLLPPDAPGTCLLEAYWPTVDREPAKPASLGSPAARGPGSRTPQRRQSQGSGHGFRGCLLTTRQLIERRWMIAEEALV